MTIEQKAIEYSKSFKDGCDDIIAYKAYITGAKENGIKWHDLRKDPNDLPKENRNTFYVVLKNGNERLMYWSTGRTKDIVTGEHIPLDFIHRWYEIQIPQFEE